jgi:hypothetical protein
MTEKHMSTEEKKNMIHKAKPESTDESHAASGDAGTLATFQQQIGNRAVQRMLAQRSGDGSFDLDDDTADRIHRERGGGQSLDSNVQTKMGESTGQDFSDVKVHTGPESHALNEQVSAKAFTTGSDIFFREGAYNPGSSDGQELLAHELTHVVQQRSGSVSGGGGGMKVNAPGDSYEQEADSVAKSVMAGGATADVQRQTTEDDKEVQAKHLQRAAMSEEEKVQTKAIQREAMPEEEEVQTKALQREAMPEEDETLQKQELDEEEKDVK